MILGNQYPWRDGYMTAFNGSDKKNPYNLASVNGIRWHNGFVAGKNARATAELKARKKA